MKKQNNSILDLTTMTGNILMVMSDEYFNGHLDFVRENNSLEFFVQKEDNEGPDTYTIKAYV